MLFLREKATKSARLKKNHKNLQIYKKSIDK